jgi:hypothetical protein
VADTIEILIGNPETILVRTVLTEPTKLMGKAKGGKRSRPEATLTQVCL